MALGLIPVDTGSTSGSVPPPAPSSSGPVDPGFNIAGPGGPTSQSDLDALTGLMQQNGAGAGQIANIQNTYGPLIGAPGSTGSGIPAGGPNYQAQPVNPPPSLSDFIGSFPGVQSAEANETQNLGLLNSALQSARERAIINFGDPALAQMAGFGLDPQAGTFAQQNYLSGNATLARLDKQHQLAQQAIINALAAHGILNSGDLGYREGQENQAYGNNVYDARQAVLDQLANLYNGYLTQRASLGNDVTNAINAALQAYLSNPDAYAGAFGAGNGGDNGTTPGGGAGYTTTPPKVKPPKATNYLGVKGPQIGAFK